MRTTLTRPTHPVPRALAAALLVATVLLTITAASTGPAGAASPPSLTATPNPVIVPIGQTSGTYDLTWNTGTTITADIQYAINGGPWSVKFPLAASGTAKDNVIQVNQTITWRLFNKGGVRPIAETTVLARHPDRSCLSQCIKDVIITPHGSYADVLVIGSAELESFNLVADSDALDAQAIGANLTDWYSTLWHLTPDTAYTYTLEVSDEAGNTQTQTGAFKTLRPQVQVNLDWIAVGDDSDDLTSGEIHWTVRAGDYWDSPNGFFADIESGSGFSPGYSTFVEPDTDDLVIGLYGIDDDQITFPLDFSQFSCWCPPSDVADHDPGAGSDVESDWATAFTTVPVLVDGVGESFTASFALGISEDPMSFLGQGTYTVTYV